MLNQYQIFDNHGNKLEQDNKQVKLCQDEIKKVRFKSQIDNFDYNQIQKVMYRQVDKKITSGKAYDSFFFDDKLDLEIHEYKKKDYIKFLAQREFVHDENMCMNPKLQDVNTNHSIDTNLNKSYHKANKVYSRFLEKLRNKKKYQSGGHQSQSITERKSIMDSQRQSLDLDQVKNQSNKFRKSQDPDVICKNQLAFPMVLDHLGQNFNGTDEQKMQFESIIQSGLKESQVIPAVKKHFTEVKEDAENSHCYIPHSKIKINVLEKPSLNDKQLFKNNDSSQIYTMNNYNIKENKKKNTNKGVSLKPTDYNAGIK